jgi:dienelactone hydrolase
LEIFYYNWVNISLVKEKKMGKNVHLSGISGYIASPSGYGPWPGLIVIQEWWGLDQQTKSITDRFSELGYLCFSPDLYHGELAQLGDA